ncbi:MAG: histidine phosphatase family protein [Chloroflexi bacterium]|nr:histidine phosphatase family protein [Chloroflexota bacterium]
MELFLVRHGRIQGMPMRPRDESPLSELGQEQARRAGVYLARSAPFALLVCSPLLRARQTAQIIGDAVQVEPVIIQDLTEMTDREMSWLVLGEIAERLPLGRRQFTKRAGIFLRAPLVGRVSGAVAKLIAEHTDQRVLMVVHGGVIWGVLAHYFPEKRAQFSRGRQVANGSITRIHIKADGAELVSLNETAHLGDTVTY